MKSISYYWKRIRLRLVSVFLFHHVSDIFEPDTMWKCDWIQTEAFKKKVLALKKKYILPTYEKDGRQYYTFASMLARKNGRPRTEG